MSLREELRRQALCPCRGLKFPSMPHLHDEDCPTGLLPESRPIFYLESARERLQFDMCGNALGLQPLQQIAMNLDTWGRMSPGGSYAQQCFIMANEALLAYEYLKIMSEIREILCESSIDVVHAINGLAVETKISLHGSQTHQHNRLRELLEKLPQPMLNNLDPDDDS